MNKVVRDGKVAVLYSPDFGAGWYTWNNKFPQCLFEPEIVALVEAEKHDAIEAVAERLYGEGFCTGGADQLEIEWLPVGTRFEIHEYDGSESVRVLSPADGFVA